MAYLTIITASPNQDPVYLGDFYASVKAARPLCLQRSVEELPRLRSLKKAMLANLVVVGVTLTAQELSDSPHDADLFAEET